MKSMIRKAGILLAMSLFLTAAAPARTPAAPAADQDLSSESTASAGVIDASGDMDEPAIVKNPVSSRNA